MLSEVDKRIIAGFSVAFVLVSITMFISYRNMSEFRSMSLNVAYTHEVLFEIEQIYSEVLEIESNKRGYVIYGDESFDTTYRARIKSVNLELDALKTIVADNPEQLRRLDTLARLIQQKIEFTSQAIDRRPELETAYTPIAGSLRGKRITEAIRRTTEAMKRAERGQLEKRMLQAAASNRQFYQLYIAFGLIITLIFVSVVFIVRGRMKERMKAEAILKARSDYIQDLYNNAPCGYHSLDERGNFVETNNTFLSWLGYDRGELLYKMNFKDLLTDEGKQQFYQTFPRFKRDGRVDGLEFELIKKSGETFPILLNSTAIYDEDGNFEKGRSTTFDITLRKLAEEKARFLNDELEAFSYSVSHDLRAPLRSIDSYTKILAEEHGTQLDDEGKRLIGVVLKNASRMAQLIDDLLDFSRVGRKELIKSEFSMSRLVRSVMEEMEIDKSTLKVNLENGATTDAWGDKNTLRQVWHNLISNALKYSSKAEQPEIEIGSYTEESETVFYIKDNGVGFDMAYYDKLFGVFQRLHTSREFDGTGVGLALCQRIVTRHEGKIWATSQLNQGATFYFSLPKNNQYNGAKNAG